MSTDPLGDWFHAEFTEHRELVDRTRVACEGPFRQLVEVSVSSIAAGGKLLFFGNGGSASDSQHLATEFTVRYVQDRVPISAIALTTDTSALTAIGNDLGFEQVFARQLQAIARRGDIAVAISTSGRSRNILAGLERARQLGLIATGLSGRDGGGMVGLAEPLLIVPSHTTARIQEMHILLGHMLCGAVERRLGLVREPSP